MFVGVNDNLTLKEFQANKEPGVSVAEVRTAEITLYGLEGERDVMGSRFTLIRVGSTKLHPQMERQRMAFPTAAVPHPMCPEHTYTPPSYSAARQGPKKVDKPLPSYLRVVA